MQNRSFHGRGLRGFEPIAGAFPCNHWGVQWRCFFGFADHLRNGGEHVAGPEHSSRIDMQAVNPLLTPPDPAPPELVAIAHGAADSRAPHDRRREGLQDAAPRRAGAAAWRRRAATTITPAGPAPRPGTSRMPVPRRRLRPARTERRLLPQQPGRGAHRHASFAARRSNEAVE